MRGKFKKGKRYRYSGTLFDVSGRFFNNKDIVDVLGHKTANAFDRIGKKIKRKAKRSLKLGKRIRSISQIGDRKTRQKYHISMSMYNRGTRKKKPLLPFRPSKPGKIPKIRSKGSTLKSLIFHDLDRVKIEVIVGPRRKTNKPTAAPRVLEHGGTSGGSRVEARPFMSRQLNSMNRSGEIASIFKRSIKI